MSGLFGIESTKSKEKDEPDASAYRLMALICHRYSTYPFFASLLRSCASRTNRYTTACDSPRRGLVAFPFHAKTASEQNLAQSNSILDRLQTPKSGSAPKPRDTTRLLVDSVRISVIHPVQLSSTLR